MRHITLNVCQGIGDIFWVYQKFSPHFDAIDFNICHIGRDNLEVQNRAKAFLPLLPKVRNVSSVIVPSAQYQSMISTRYFMNYIMEQYNRGTREFFYSCNKPLEDGIRIEKIDPDFAIEETVELPVANEQGFPHPPQKYITAYVSGMCFDKIVKNHGGWTVEQWAEFIYKFYKAKQITKQLVLIGASYDRTALQTVKRILEKKIKIQVPMYIDYHPANVHYILKNTAFFIGYQSGLSILADNLDVPQVMMYFRKLDKMLYTWPKKQNIKNGLYTPVIFDETHENIIEKVNIL